MKRLNNKGFTLIEVIAAITIMGVLSSTAIVGVSNKVNKSHKEFCSSQVNILEIAGRDYFNDNQSLLPLNIGMQECVSLNTLLGNKYIEGMQDYNGNSCNANTSKVCSIKRTKNSYYYTTYLDCSGCKTDNTDPSHQEDKPKVTFTPGTATNTTNKDLNIIMHISDELYPVVSYAYTIYQKTEKGDIPVERVDFKEYKGQDIEIKLNRKGTYYIVGEAYNSIGNYSTNKGGDYTLKYNLECKGQIQVTAKNHETGAKVNEQTWMKGGIDITIKKSGDVESFDVYIGKAGGPFQKVELPFEEVATKASAITRTIKFDNTKTDIYRVYVVAYNDQGDQCTTNDGQGKNGYYEFWQDNEPPKCETKGGTGEQWVNHDITLSALCDDWAVGSGCNKSKMPTNTITIEYDGMATAGTIYDNVGNSTLCPYVRVRIDKTPPTCSVSLNGDRGNNGYFISAVTSYLSYDDPAPNGIASGVPEYGYGMNYYGYEEYNNFKMLTYSNNTNTLTTTYGYVKDRAGNKNNCQSESFMVDRTPPTYNISGSPPSGMINFSCSDIGSGVLSGDRTFFFPVPGNNGDSVTVSGQCEDIAGNKSSEYSHTYNFCPNHAQCGWKTCNACGYACKIMDCGAELCWNDAGYCEPDITWTDTGGGNNFGDDGDDDDNDNKPDPDTGDANIECPKMTSTAQTGQWLNKTFSITFKWASGIPKEVKNYTLYNQEKTCTGPKSSDCGSFGSWKDAQSHTASNQYLTQKILVTPNEGKDRKIHFMIELKDASNKTLKKCSYTDQTFYIDTTPPELTAMCPFHANSQYPNGFECHNDDLDVLYDGVFVRIEDKISIIAANNTFKIQQGGQTKNQTRSGKGERGDQWCLGFIKGTNPNGGMLSYKICDSLGNCREKSGVNIRQMGAFYNSVSCEEMKKSHKN